jgi:tetratricopeptide (TPR) repeat protein
VSKPLKGFITYSHKDKRAKDKLLTCLEPMKREGLIDPWHDNEIIPGDKWREEIFSSNLPNSDIWIYLVSSDSLASETCNKELALILEKNITPILIILEDCDWKNYKLSNVQALSDESSFHSEWESQKLSDFQALPAEGRPLNEWNPRSKGWQSVVEGIREVVHKIQLQTMAELAFKQGNFLLTLRQFDKAIVAYSRAIELNSRYTDAYNNRGIAYERTGSYEKAIEDYDNVMALNPKSFVAYNNRGTIHAKKRAYNLAIADFNKAIELHPVYVEAYCNRGTAFYLQNEFEIAIENFNKAADLNPHHAGTYNNRGATYGSNGEHTKAIKDFTTSIELSPRDPGIYNNRGLVYANKLDFDKAIKDYNKAIALKPNFAKVYINRGVAYHHKGQYERAIENYNKAIALKPDDILGYNNRGLSYTLNGEPDRAIDDYNEVIKRDPYFPEIYKNRGAAYGSKGEVDLAIRDFNKAIEIDSIHVDNYINLGAAHANKGEYDEAIAAYTKAIELNPEEVVAYINRGVVYFIKDEVKRAIENYNKVIELKPDNAEVYYYRAVTWLYLKEWEKTKVDLQTAKKMGMDIFAAFCNNYKNVETYEKRHRVKLPEDIALLLTERRRTRYPKTRDILDADGNPFESPDVVNLREQLRNVGPPLSEYIKAKSAFGINTTPTEVFVIDKTTRDTLIASHPSSAEILKPFLHGKDLRRWHVDTPQEWLIFAHRGIAINDYPAILKYLEKHRESLSKRKGKQEWYELQASFSDAERFAQPKLVCPNSYNHQTFAVDTAGYFYGNTSYLIPTEEKWLCGLLNSRTVEWFYSQVSNQLTIDPLRARSGYIQQIPIPRITPVHKALIAKIVDYLNYLQQQPEINSKDLKYARDRIMLGYFERAIDGLVYEAYLPEELHKSDKVFLQPLLDEGLPLIEEIQGDKMTVFQDIFERLYDRMHLVRRHLYYMDSIKPIRIIQGKL